MSNREDLSFSDNYGQFQVTLIGTQPKFRIT